MPGRYLCAMSGDSQNSARASPLYRNVAPRVSFPDLEEQILNFWRDERIFDRSLEARSGAPEWVFYEGPPTANGRPGIHHVEARTFKDFFCRFQTMRGRYVHRKAGWDCHGLPVEVEVEKELGITHKRQIEEIGIEEFTQRCRESVQRYVADWKALTERIGFWVDMDSAYWTMTPEYVESVWWLLKQIWDKGLLEEDFKVVPYCPRCETALSNHEQHMTGAYQTVVDPSVFVRFPLEDEPDTSLLVWTTTPWTLLSNLAAAVGPDFSYVKVKDPDVEGRFLVIARDRLEPLLAEAEIVAEFPGRELLDRRYLPPYEFVPTVGHAHTVRPGDFVTTEDGTGIVHLAPYGEDDIDVAKRDDLPIVQMIDGSGRVVDGGGKFAGLWLKDADEVIIEDLSDKGKLFLFESYEHAYPHCWRCDTPLLYFARKDWYIRTSQVRSELQASNEETNWQPPTVKYGRFGDWLANNVDWSLSRDRYWGTPLPIWRCEEKHTVCVGSFAELGELAGRDLKADPGAPFDPHRPYVDAIEFSCPTCGKTARRVTSVIDAWFDSGAMPFGQWHYPFENEDLFEQRFPADFISEAIDQTRGWFYSLLAIATLVRGQNSYRNCVCLGLIVDEQGRKMSKSLGNVIDPWTVCNQQGADALRWYMLSGGAPWSARRVGPQTIEESLRRFHLTLWNTYSFWVTYAALEGFDPSEADVPVSERSELDRWILAELDDTVRVLTDSLEAFDPTTGGKRLDRLVDDLSNWYVRRSRRRFWKSGTDTDTRAAFLTLWECLVTAAQLSAPYMPFLSEEIYTNLTGPLPDAPPSVHMSDWPAAHAERRDDALRRRVGLARKLVGLGRSARAEAKVRTRQPLGKAFVVVPPADQTDFEFVIDDFKQELNVKDAVVAEDLGEYVTYEVKPNFKALGPRFGKDVGAIASALNQQDAAAIAVAVENTGEIRLPVGDREIVLTRDDLDIRIRQRTKFHVATEGPYAVALDLELTPELSAEGTAREVVRAVQDLRKTSGLAVEDRIELWLIPSTDDALAALRAHESYILAEVLSTSSHVGEDPPREVFRGSVETDQGSIGFGLRKAGSA
jgi:isoleucyl-tRNA synthetase